MVLNELLPRLTNVKANGSGYTARCPSHDDQHNSLSVTERDGKLLIHCHAGCPTRSVLDALGLVMTDLFHKPGRNGHKSKQRVIVATYDYHDPDGRLLYQVVRYRPKDFKQRRPDGKGGWTWNLNGVERVLYRLPELRRADPAEWVLVSEGEKDADNLARLGLVATTNPGGAGKWRDEYAQELRGRRIAILPDNDKHGRDHAAQVASSVRRVAAEVRIVELPELPYKGDVSDWLAAGHTREELLELVEGAPTWEPLAEEVPEAREGGKIPLADFHNTDLGNAHRLIALHGQDLRYCAQWRQWFIWDGKRWARDTTNEIHRRAQDTVRQLYKEAADGPDPDIRKNLATWALRSESRERIESMVALARFASEVVVTPSQFDADPMLLNVENGTIDLSTGQLRPHRREDLITKLAPVRYDPNAKFELWDRFIETATDGDGDLAGFLQRAAGYALTGSTAEEVLFFVHGPAASGKSTFIEALKATLGDYATTADFEAFLSRRDVGGPRNDIARLAGARFVASIEVDEGKRLAEGLVKMLTGGDTVSCRFLHQEFFEYTPQFKLFLAANHAPKVREDDEAMWRRILRVPFEHVIPKDERDPLVKATLRDPTVAGPAILAWAVKGCLEWQSKGLGVPPRVEQATSAYREQMDPLKGFLDEYCVLSPDEWVSANDLRAAYEVWTKENGERDLLRGRTWGEKLRVRGCRPEHRRVQDPTTGRERVTRGWVGIRLANDESDDDLVTDSAFVTECNAKIDNLHSDPVHEGKLPKMPLQPLQDPHSVTNHWTSTGQDGDACHICGGSPFCRGDDGETYCKTHAPEDQRWHPV